MVPAEKGFFVIIEQNGTYSAGQLEIQACSQEEGVVLSCRTSAGQECQLYVPGLRYPFAFRTRQSGDSVLASNGSMKAVSRIAEDWKCQSRALPVIQELSTPEQNIVALWGALFGAKNWIVKGIKYEA